MSKQVVKFSIQAPVNSKVEIAGDFTDWLNAPLQLTDVGNGIFERKVVFNDYSRFEYKYLIDGQWVENMAEISPGSQIIPNAFGTKNFLFDKDCIRCFDRFSRGRKPIVDKKAHRLLIKCAEKREFKDWNKWRKSNDFRKIYLQDLNLSCMYFEGANLSNINFEYSNFSCSLMSSACFDNSELRYTDLRKVCFSNGSAQHANFCNADMRGALLTGTKFVKCRMLAANCRGATARYVVIQGADLHHAKLESADFSFAVVDGETLIDTVHVDRRTLFVSVGLDSARLNSGLIDTLKYNIRRHRWEEWYHTGSFLNKSYKNMIVRPFWKISNYGRSTARIIYIFAVLATIFGLIYWFNPDIIINLNSEDTVTKLYHTASFSVVTMITLGFGSMNAAPASLLGHVTVALQVTAGYIILAALVSRIAIIFNSDGPDIEHKPLYKPGKEFDEK